MELNEKLQQLRKQKGITQEELAGALYVSRTAISKWESGRGYPNIDSLKAIAKYFDITIDELLSGEQLLTIAEADTQKKEQRTRNLVFALLDISGVMLLFLPFFGQRTAGAVQSVPLLSMEGIAPYLLTAYLIVVLAMVVWGILSLAMQNRGKGKVSLLINVVAAALFVISLQPYVALYLLVLLAIKVLMVVKWR